MSDNRKWYNIELEVAEATSLKKYCKDKGYRYSASECYNLIHIEVYLTMEELEDLNYWIEMNI